MEGEMERKPSASLCYHSPSELLPHQRWGRAGFQFQHLGISYNELRPFSGPCWHTGRLERKGWRRGSTWCLYYPKRLRMLRLAPGLASCSLATTHCSKDRGMSPLSRRTAAPLSDHTRSSPVTVGRVCLCGVMGGEFSGGVSHCREKSALREGADHPSAAFHLVLWLAGIGRGSPQCLNTSRSPSHHL